MLFRSLGVEIPRGVAVLDRTLRALEKYTELAPPPAPSLPPPGARDQPDDSASARGFGDASETLSLPRTKEDRIGEEVQSHQRTPETDEVVFPEADDPEAGAAVRRIVDGKDSPAASVAEISELSSAETESFSAETEANDDSDSGDSEGGDDE